MLGMRWSVLFGFQFTLLYLKIFQDFIIPSMLEKHSYSVNLVVIDITVLDFWKPLGLNMQNPFG